MKVSNFPLSCLLYVRSKNFEYGGCDLEMMKSKVKSPLVEAHFIYRGPF
jgi:hypothetical protein